MIDLDTCRKILEQDGDQYTDEEVKQIAALLWEFANLSAEKFLKEQNTTVYEKSNFDGQGQFG